MDLVRLRYFRTVAKVPLLIVEPKQKLIPSAPDYVIPETAYDTIPTPIILILTVD